MIVGDGGVALPRRDEVADTVTTDTYYGNNGSNVKLGEGGCVHMSATIGDERSM